MPGTTIYDVAERAGVSIATVSRVLNTPKHVPHATRSRVMHAIDALGFVPRAEASARARKGTRRVGVLAPFFTFPSFTQRLRGVSAALTGSAYDLVIYNVEISAHRDAYLAALSINRRLDGLIIMALPFSADAAQRLLLNDLPTVLIECAHAGFSSVEIDDEEGGRLVAEYCVAQGYRRCGFLGDADVPDYAVHTSDFRLQGYRRALHTAGVALAEELVALAPHGLESARQQTHGLLSRAEPPRAIFAASDTQALGALRAAHERGLRVPADLAIIGFDDLDLASYIGLTTVHQSLDESGSIAVEMLLAQINDRERGVRHVRLPLTLVLRETA